MNATAATILVQLTHAADEKRAVGRLVSMLGAKTIGYDAASISFRFAAKSMNGANHCAIKLDADDTCSVTFYSIRGVKVRTVSELSGVYAEDLRRLFEESTGLYLSL